MLRKLALFALISTAAAQINGYPSIKPTAFEPYLQPPSPALAGLWIDTNPGIVWMGGNPTTIPVARVHLTASATNYVYVNLVTNTIQVNTTGFGSTIFPIAIVSTNNTQTTTVQDVRPDVYGSGGGGGGGGANNEVNNVSLPDQTILNFVDASGIHFNNPSGGIVTAQVQGNIVPETVTISLPSDTGSVNAYAACPSPSNPTLAKGLQIPFIPANTNTTASTFSLCGSASVAILKGTAALVAGDILVSNPITLMFDGSHWQDPTPYSVPSRVSSITTDSQSAVTGPFTTAAGDYGIKGIAQPGSGTLNISCTITGTCKFGNSSNFISANPTSSTNAIAIIDTYGNAIGTNASGSGLGTNGNYIAISTGSTGAQLYLFGAPNGGELQVLLNSNPTPYLDITPTTTTFNSTNALFNSVVNFAGTGAFKIGGSFGTTGQCVLSTGTGIAFGSCASGTVTSVGVTTNQTFNTGTSTAPVIALFGGAHGGSSPLVFPGNLSATQFANGDTMFNEIRSTDTLTGGFFHVGNKAGGGVLYSIDTSGNGFFNSLATSDSTNAGYFGFVQGPDAFSACSGAAPANVICEYAPTSVTASYGVIKAGTGPAAVSVPVYTALSSNTTTQSFVPLSGSTAAIASAAASLAGALNGNIVTSDGSGNVKNSGVNISSVLPSIQGPGTAYTNGTTSGTTVFTYSTTIQGSTTVMIDCAGSYKFTTAAEQAEFGINFTSAPTNLFLNVEIGGNATTGTHTYGRQTTNGALITAGIAAAATGTYYPVWIHGGVTLNASSTFTIQGATNNAAGTLNVDQNGFTCSVR